MTCLLIDDDLDDQEIFCMALREVNPHIECMLAKDGREGLEKLRLLKGEIHDFIFIDLNMPKLDGMATLKQIKKIPSLNNAKVIIYSTSSNKKTIEAALNGGADYFLVKPTRTEDLKKELRTILEQWDDAGF